MGYKTCQIERTRQVNTWRCEMTVQVVDMRANKQLPKTVTPLMLGIAYHHKYIPLYGEAMQVMEVRRRKDGEKYVFEDEYVWKPDDAKWDMGEVRIYGGEELIGGKKHHTFWTTGCYKFRYAYRADDFNIKLMIPLNKLVPIGRKEQEVQPVPVVIKHYLHTKLWHPNATVVLEHAGTKAAVLYLDIENSEWVLELEEVTVQIGQRAIFVTVKDSVTPQSYPVLNGMRICVVENELGTNVSFHDN